MSAAVDPDVAENKITDAGVAALVEDCLDDDIRLVVFGDAKKRQIVVLFVVAAVVLANI